MTRADFERLVRLGSRYDGFLLYILCEGFLRGKYGDHVRDDYIRAVELAVSRAGDGLDEAYKSITGG